MARVDPPLGFPSTVNICGIPHEVQYYDNAHEVDHDRGQLLNGQIFYEEATIRILATDRPIEMIFATLLHEVIHGVLRGLRISGWDDEKHHDEYTALCLALSDTLMRNGWVKPRLLDPIIPRE